jgi:hypothetical protein
MSSIDVEACEGAAVARGAAAPAAARGRGRQVD